MAIRIQGHETWSQPLDHQAMFHEGRGLAYLLQYTGIFIYTYSKSHAHTVMHGERKDTQVCRHSNKRMDKRTGGWIHYEKASLQHDLSYLNSLNSLFSLV